MTAHDIVLACQWPAMALALIGTFLVSTNQQVYRRRGFVTWMASNGLWVAYGVHLGLWAFAVQQAAFFYLSVRGWLNTSEPDFLPSAWVPTGEVAVERRMTITEFDP